MSIRHASYSSHTSVNGHSLRSGLKIELFAVVLTPISIPGPHVITQEKRAMSTKRPIKNKIELYTFFNEL